MDASYLAGTLLLRGHRNHSHRHLTQHSLLNLGCSCASPTLPPAVPPGSKESPRSDSWTPRHQAASCQLLPGPRGDIHTRDTACLLSHSWAHSATVTLVSVGHSDVPVPKATLCSQSLWHWGNQPSTKWGRHRARQKCRCTRLSMPGLSPTGCTPLIQSWNGALYQKG